MKLPTVFLLVLALPWLARSSDDLPADVERVLKGLTDFEREVQSEAAEKIAGKREEVVRFLGTSLDRETKAGKLDAALAIRELIESLATSAPAAETKQKAFAEWARSIEMHETDGWWEIDGDELVQHLENGSVRRFRFEINVGRKEVKFSTGGRAYVFQFLPDRTRGIRSRDDDWPARAFTVEPKR